MSQIILRLDKEPPRCTATPSEPFKYHDLMPGLRKAVGNICVVANLLSHG